MFGGVALKKLLTFVLVASMTFSLYVIWLKWNTACISCGDSITLGLPVNQLKLAVLAFVGLLIISAIYYVSYRIRAFQYISLGISGISVAISSFLMAFQIMNIICWPCLISDILFCLIFFLLCMDFSYRSQGKEKTNLT